MPAFWTPPALPPSNRTNTTLQADNHPGDHNVVSTALQAIIDQLIGAPGVKAYTGAQINALSGQPAGMIVYQIDSISGRTSPGFYYWDSAAWQPVGSGGGAVGAELIANKNQPGGYAGLDVNGFLDKNQLGVVVQSGTRTVTSSGAANTVDFAYGINWIKLTADCTLSFINQAAGLRTTVILEQAGVGGFAVTWPSSATFGWDQNLIPYYTKGVTTKTFIDLMSVDGTITVGFAQSKDRSDQHLRSTALETIPRQYLLTAGANATLPNGTMRLVYFTPDRLFAAANIETFGITAATTAPTYAAVGLYVVNTDGSLSLLGVSTSDVAMWTTGTGNSWVKALSASSRLWPGSYYAIGTLYYNGGTQGSTTGIPTIFSTRNGLAASALFGRAPRMTGSVTGLTTIPASVAVGSILDWDTMIYAEMTP
jgi:hypothetical protein